MFDMRIVRALCAGVLILIATGCAETAHGVAPSAPIPSERRPSPQEIAVDADLDGATKAFVAGDTMAAADFLSRARTHAAHDLRLHNRIANKDAAFHVERGDLDGAVRLIRERIAVAQRENHFSELDLHDHMLFLCEARGDRVCALLEALEMRTAVERIPPPWSPQLRQGYYWQRAHTLLHFAETLEGDARAAALLYAEKARTEFAALARESRHALQSIALLDEEFQAMNGDCPAALATARGLRQEDLDPQDMYTTASVLAHCGEDAAASKLRERLMKGNEVGLFESVYRYMAKRDEAGRRGLGATGTVAPAR
jgi:hypothetical protein